MADAQRMNFEGAFEMDSEHIVEQFLEHETDEVEFQHFGEVYSILNAIDNYEGEKRQRLIDHVDNYADEIPVSTPNDSLYENASEIAEGLKEKFSERTETLDDYPLSVLEQKTQAYLGDRLRYFEDSDHRK